MDYKKSKAPVNTVTRNVMDLCKDTGYNDSLEEVFENREQIEISRYYEKLPKPSLLATQEFVDNQVYWRDPYKDLQKDKDLESAGA